MLKKSIAAKISVLLLGMMILCAVTVGVSGIVLYRSNAIEANALRAMHIAESAAAMIDGDEFTAIMEMLEPTEYYAQIKASLDEMARRTGVQYLYVLDSKYGDHMTYFAEGFNRTTDEEEILLGDQEALIMDGEEVYPAEMFQALGDGAPRTTDIYDSGDFGQMVSGYALIKNAAGRTVGIAGADISIDDVMDDVTAFTLRIVLIIAGFCIVLGVLCVYLMRRIIGRPLATLTQASDRMAEGDISIHLEDKRVDEIGVLAASFDRMAGNIREQVEVLEQLAMGDLSVKAHPRGPADAMGYALQSTLENLNQMFDEIRSSAGQVTLGSRQIAQAAQMLASGSTQQAASVQQYTQTIETVLGQSRQNAEQAVHAYEDTRKMSGLMEESISSMEQMLESMRGISASSQQIAKVIKVIEDIAFQTNILALNAAVEAAHAGQHGKGFAVVAEEVRGLANKSAEAAKETAALIEDSVARIQEGNEIVDRTNEMLRSVVDLAGGNAASMNAINLASGRQSETIYELTQGMEQISTVVQQNSATAEESAASAQEMAAQAHVLDDIVARFKLKDAAPRLEAGDPYEI